MREDRWEILRYDEVTSTNDVAKNLSVEFSGKNIVVTATRQTAGRGRRGRAWQSLEGNLFFSQMFNAANRPLTEVVFLVSLSLYQAIAGLAPQGKVELKWPNDILLENRKVSGILLEKGENTYIIAGIGVNIAAAPIIDETYAYKVAALSDFGFTTNSEMLLQAYLQAFDKNLALYDEQGFEIVRERWLDKAKGLGDEIVVNLNNGQERGVFAGIAANGALLLRQGEMVKSILAGDVFYKEEK